MQEPNDFSLFKFKLKRLFNVSSSKEKIERTRLDLSNPFNYVPKEEYEDLENESKVEDLKPKTISTKPKSIPNGKERENIPNGKESISKLRERSSKSFERFIKFILFGSHQFYNKHTVPKVVSLKDLWLLFFSFLLVGLLGFKVQLFGYPFLAISVFLIFMILKIVYFTLRVYFSKFLSYDVFVVFLGWGILLLTMLMFSLSVSLKPFVGPFDKATVVVKEIETPNDKSCLIVAKDGNSFKSVYPFKNVSSMEKGKRYEVKYFSFLGGLYFIDFKRV